MKVAVNAADETLPPTLPQQGDDALMASAAGARQRLDFSGGKNVGIVPERLGVLVDIGTERRDPGVRFDGRRLGVGRGDRPAQSIGQRVVDFADDVVERALLVETPHIDRPFDRVA